MSFVINQCIACCTRVCSVDFCGSNVKDGLSRTSRNQTGESEFYATKNTRLCEQVWTIHRFTSAHLFLRIAGVFDETLVGSGYSGNVMLARLDDCCIKFFSENAKT